MPVALQNITSPIGMMASAQLCATLPNFFMLEHHGLGVPFFEDLASGRERLVIEGHMLLGRSPGLGISLNEEVAYWYRKQEEPFFGH